MQTALGLGHSTPTPSTFIFAKQHGTGAGPATNARVSLVVQHVVGDIVLCDHLPHILLGPIGKWTDLHQRKLLVPANDWRPCPVRTLISTDGTHPSMFALDCLPQHNKFAVVAALVRLGLVERTAVLGLVFFDRKLRSL